MQFTLDFGPELMISELSQIRFVLVNILLRLRFFGNFCRDCKAYLEYIGSDDCISWENNRLQLVYYLLTGSY